MENNEIQLVLLETRVKKYKKYRRAIKNDYSSYLRKNSKNDEIKEVEKAIVKVDKNLLMKKKNDDIFYVDFTNAWTDGDRTIVAAKNYLENMRNCNFSELLSKASSIKNDVDFEPRFDSYGNISSVWLDDDPKYSDLVELKNWISTMIENKETIINNTRERIRFFKDAFYKSTNPTIVQQILPTDKQETTFKVNKKNKKIFLIFSICFFVAIFSALIFLIIFFVGIN